jgi:hypothetical protein
MPSFETRGVQYQLSAPTIVHDLTRGRVPIPSHPIMIIVRLLSPGPWLVATTKVYPGVGADIVMESITLVDPVTGVLSVIGIFQQLRCCWQALAASESLLALGVLTANMQCKLFVSLQLEVSHHVIERRASGCTRGFEPPATFGATKPSKALLFNPHQFPTHGRLCRRAPTLSDRMPSILLPLGAIS